MKQHISIKIIIGILLLFLVLCMLKNTRENYDQMSFCAKKYYRTISQSKPYISCKPYGYVRRTRLSKLIPMYKCKIGLPSDSRKFLIYIDDIARFSGLTNYNFEEPIIGQHIRFDDNNDYILVKKL